MRCIEHPTPRNWRLYTLTSVLIAYSHFYGVLVVIAHWLSLMLLPCEIRPYVLANAQPGDGIFFYTASGRKTFEYYRLLSGRAPKYPEVIYPSSGVRMTYRDFLVTPLAEVLQDPLPEPKRVWLFLNGHRAGGRMDMGSEVMCAWYGTRYRLLSKHTVDGLDLLLYDRER